MKILNCLKCGKVVKTGKCISCMSLLEILATTFGSIAGASLAIGTLEPVFDI